MRISGSSAVPALLLVLLACAAARVAVVLGDTASACDGISCGMGTCKEAPPLIPFLSNVSTYECDCYPGWANFVPLSTLTACYIPTCRSDLSCNLPNFKVPPLGSNLTLHPCSGMNCGPEGTCVEEQGKQLQCRCKPGAANLGNNPSFPCSNNCVIGQDGCLVPSPPPPPQSSSSAPPGYVCLQILVLLASLAALHIV